MHPSTGGQWFDLDPTKYPYANPRSLDIPECPDFFERNPISLLSSFSAFANGLLKKTKINKGIVEFRFGFGTDNRLSVKDVERLQRVCSSSMSNDDYVDIFRQVVPLPGAKHTAAFHIDIINQHENTIFEELPELVRYAEILFSTFSASGTVVLYFVQTHNHTVETFCSSEIGLNVIQPQVEKLSRLLFKTYHHNFSIERRLKEIPVDLHKDPLLSSLFLAYAINRHYRYLDANVKLLYQFHLWILRTSVDYHDYYLGHVLPSSVTEELLPFAKSIDQQQFQDISREGWYIQEVEGDGHCGYYSLFLGLQNVGIKDWHLDISNRPKLQGQRDWQSQVIKFRKFLFNQSNLIIQKVYPRGSKGRQLSWWIECVGAYNDDLIDALSEPFVLPKQVRESVYYSKEFAEEADSKVIDFFPKFKDKKKSLKDYHMDVYWTAVVVAYTLKVRVVVVTRFTKPAGEDTPANQVVVAKCHKGNSYNVTYEHFTKIFEFPDDFDKKRDTYNPITEHTNLFRIPDEEFISKQTIELLFTTGNLAPLVSEDNHVMFLRRILCHKVPKKIGYGGTLFKMRRLVVSTKKKVPPPSDCDPVQPMDEPHEVVMPDTGTTNANVPPPPEREQTTLEAQPVEHPGTGTTNANVPPPPEREQTTLEAQPVEPPPAVNVGLNIPTEMEVDQPAKEQPVRASITPRTGKQFIPSKGKQVSKKKTEKVVTKKKRQAKVARREATMTMEPPPEQLDDGNNVSQNKSIMYDPLSDTFIEAQFDNKKRRYVNKCQVGDLSQIDEDQRKDAKRKPNTWISPPIGDPWDFPPPPHLTTKVKTLYEQLGRRFCISYSVASALFYCGFKEQAMILAEQAQTFSKIDMTTALKSMDDFFQHNVCPIGQPWIYNVRLSANNRCKRKMDWNDLFTNITPYPTLVVPVTKSGRMNHAFCVVDDLIFDSSTPYALPLRMESVSWIFDGEEVDIYTAHRYQQKFSVKKRGTKETYTRSVVYHWKREPLDMPERQLKNKVYDVEVEGELDPNEVRFVNQFGMMEIDLGTSW